MSTTETENAVIGTQAEAAEAPVVESPAPVEDSPGIEDRVVEDSDTGTDDAGGSVDAPPAEVSDELRARSRGMFSDDELRALGTPEAVDTARRSLLAAMAAQGMDAPAAERPEPKSQPEASAPKPEAAKPTTTFEFKVSREKFDDDQAAEIEQGFKQLYEQLSGQIAPTAQTVEQITSAIRAQQAGAQENYQKMLVSSLGSIQKELGSEYSELFGNMPVAEIVKRPDSPEFKRLNKLVIAMERADQRAGIGGPAKWDADFARDMIYATRDPELIQSAERARRKAFNGAVNGMAKGTTRAPAPRHESAAKTFEQLREEAIAEAKTIRAKGKQ